MLRIKNNIGHIANAEFHPIVLFQGFALDPLAIDESSVLAALIKHIELAVLGRYQRMIPRDPRVGNHQILVDLSTYSERGVVEIDGALLVSLHEDQDGENT